MNDFEKQFEQIVAGLNIDDRPTAEHKETLRKRMLMAHGESSLKSARRIQPVWSKIMKSTITKTAAAAVIIITILIGINQFGGTLNMTNIVLAKVAQTVENIENVVFQTTVEITDENKGAIPQTAGTTYVSLKYGTRTDMSAVNKPTEILYLIPKDNVAIGLLPANKTYTRFVLSPEQARQMNEKKDPRQIIKHLLSTDYKHAGHDKINGLDVEVIECKGTRIMGGMFENAIVHLWVETGTNLPVRVEIEGEAAGGKMQMKMVLYDFQWNVKLEPSIFEPNIPSDYIANEKKMPNVNDITEERCIKGLQVFAELTDGRYPSNLAVITTMMEVNEASKIKFGSKLTEQDGGQQQYEDILLVCGFYAKLVRENKDAAYHGDIVTKDESDKILMRWKISENQYRIIFGNLTLKTVTAEDLAELEKATLE